MTREPRTFQMEVVPDMCASEVNDSMEVFQVEISIGNVEVARFQLTIPLGFLPYRQLLMLR